VTTIRLDLRRILNVSLAVLLLASMLLAIPSVSAQTPASWRGEYYNNTSFSGSPALVRNDPSINFSWGDNSPGPGVNSNYFSVRWTAYVYFDAGTYTFNVTTDDGARLWVDEVQILNEWRDQAKKSFSAARTLGAGYHSIRLEYYDAGGQAVIMFNWSPGGVGPGPGPGPTGDWLGEYFGNASLGGSPLLTRNDGAVNFDWGYGSPAPSIPSEYFSARWTRQVYFSAGTWTFTATTDDGIRVWVDNNAVIDKWFPQSKTTYSKSIYLAAGYHQVRVEYFEVTGVALCIVGWGGGAGSPPQTTITVDELDPGFVWGGTRGSFYGRSLGYRGHLYWTWNSDTKMYNWAKWFPHIPTAGNWEVYVYVASRYFGTTRANYDIYHNGVRNRRTINQARYYDQWVSLGVYYFSGGSGEYVFLSDVTGDPYATRYVGFDAVRFVLRDGAPQPPPPPQTPVPWPPSPTPVLPPTPTPAPPPPTPPSGCSIAPVLGFGRVWSTYAAVKNGLHCPTEQEKGTLGAEQAFQGGLMLWRQDADHIFVLYNNGTWKRYVDTWNEGEPESDSSIVAPSGLYQPVRGFGKVWRSDPTVRNGLGWATMQERGFTASVQQYQGGLMFWSNVRGIYVLYDNGRWERYN